MHFVVSPVELGRGEALPAGINLAELDFKVVEHTPTARATHVELAKG